MFNLTRRALPWVLLALAGPLVATYAGAQTAVVDTGFAEVTFDAQAGTFSSILPFDIPYRLTTTVPEGTSRVTIKFAAQPRRQGPLRIDDECRILPPSSATPPTEAELAALAKLWSPVYGSTPRANNSVQWLLPRLEAERYYVFCFELQKELTEDQLAVFRSAVEEALDRQLAQIDSADLTAAQTTAICRDLRARLLDAAGADKVATPNSLFDCEAGPQQLADFANAVSVGVLQPQGRIRRTLAGSEAVGSLPAVPSLSARQGAFADQLRALLGDPALSQLYELLERQAADDSAFSQRLDQDFAAGRDLIAPGGPSADALAQGSPAGGAAAVTPTGLSSDPATVQTLAASYDATQKAVANLESLIGWALGQPNIAGGLTDGQRTSLAALVRDNGATDTAGDSAFRLAGLTRNLSTQLTARTQAVAALAERVRLAAADVVLADGSTSGNFQTTQRNYVSMDAGLLWAPELDEIVPYVGTNLYFRPVNKNAPLKTLGTFGQTFTRRFALTFGLTGSSISDSDEAGGKTRTDLFASQSLILGAGLRLTDSLRLGAGALVFKENDPSPLIDNSSLATSYYLTFSFDVDVVRLFGSAFGNTLLGTANP